MSTDNITYVLVNIDEDRDVKRTYQIIGSSKEQAIEEMINQINQRRYEELDEETIAMIRTEERYFTWTWERKGRFDCFYILEMKNGLIVDTIDINLYFKNWPLPSSP